MAADKPTFEEFAAQYAENEEEALEAFGSQSDEDQMRILAEGYEVWAKANGYRK